jgi:hypothetical protein
VEDKSYQPFIVCGQIVLKKNLELEIKGVEDSPDENHALSLHINKGERFKIKFKQTFIDEKSPLASGHNQRREIS